MLQKKENWERQLSDVIASRFDAPFVWGKHDCGLFVADCVEAMTDIDVAASFRGRYKTAIGSARILKRFASGSVVEAAYKIANYYKVPEVLPAYAKRGDVVIFETSESETAVGIIGLSGREILTATHQGIASITLPCHDIITCFSLD